MNNLRAKGILDDCSAELNRIQEIIAQLKPLDDSVPFLTKYALIRACGAAEVTFKAIVSDFVTAEASTQIKNFIDARVVQSSANPSHQNICGLLSAFDETWAVAFKKRVSDHEHSGKLHSALTSLNESRNDLAHGGSPSISFGDIVRYFINVRIVMEMLDAVVV